MFLVRPEVPAPLSVDRDVWPALAVNPDESYPLSLWGSTSPAPVIIEIEVVATDQQSYDYWDGILFGRLRPEKDAALRIILRDLGYDVADRYFVSGLSNCLLSPAELAEIRKTWSCSINDRGLFEGIAAAKAFRSVCYCLVPEHAPFETYHLRQIEIPA